MTLTSLVELRLPPVRNHENLVEGCESVRYVTKPPVVRRSTVRNVPSACKLFYISAAGYQ